MITRAGSRINSNSFEEGRNFVEFGAEGTRSM